MVQNAGSSQDAVGTRGQPSSRVVGVESPPATTQIPCAGPTAILTIVPGANGPQLTAGVFVSSSTGRVLRVGGVTFVIAASRSCISRFMVSLSRAEPL